MKKHVLHIDRPAQNIPSAVLPDGAVTGNGDVTVMLGGTADRIRLYVGKTDFWRADGRVTENGAHGGIAPAGLAEILIPHMAYSPYDASQDLDEAHVSLNLRAGRFSAGLKVTACAGENVILIEIDRSYPAVSVSASLIELTESGAIIDSGTYGDVSYVVRGFNGECCRFPSYAICALKLISRVRKGDSEHLIWALGVRTNHDSAAYKPETLEYIDSLTHEDCLALLESHRRWWNDFWSRSAVELNDPLLELYWYAGIYAVACTAGNKKFPPGIWGAYATSDNMAWFGDYHLNYNFEAPFYPLTAANHAEILGCYMAPLNAFLPLAKKYSRDFLGVKGALFPVGIGPMGMETDIWPNTKEHGHAFHGQKSNGSYALVIPMMHWYSTRDAEFARREYYDYLVSTAEFWENYLVPEDGKYNIYNDALNEVGWYSEYDYQPHGHDDINPAVSLGLAKMVMKLAADVSEELGLNAERIPVWRHMADNISVPDTFEKNGKLYLRGISGSDELRELSLEYCYPVGAVGVFSAPELFAACRNNHEALAIWESENRFCSYYPMAARLGIDPDVIVANIHRMIGERGLPNGMFRFIGGGLENSAAVPGTVNEMLLQSYDGVVRLFPCWNRAWDASFKNLRAYGAFTVSAELRSGVVNAEIVSEKGITLRIEKPLDGCFALWRGNEIPLCDGITQIDTEPGEIVRITQRGTVPG